MPTHAALPTLADVRPIKTEADYENALSLIEQLFDVKEESEEFDVLDLLVTLVEAYEAKHYPIDAPDPISAIEYAMEKHGLTRQDLESVIGPSGRVSEVLNRQRPLTIKMIRRLNETYQIRADVLIMDYPLLKRRTGERK